MNTNEKIYSELTSVNNPLGTIGTISPEGKPQSATVYYVYDKEANIYFITREGSRKFINIKNDPHVSFVVASEKPPKTVQIEGVAREVTEPNEEGEYFTRLVSLASEHIVMPPVSQMEGSKMIFMKVVTSWARVGNFEAMKEGDKFIEK